MDENNFYYRGIFYDNEQDFWKSVMQYGTSKITDFSLQDLIHDLYLDLKINLFVARHIKISNNELCKILAEEMLLILQKILKKQDEMDSLIHEPFLESAILSSENLNIKNQSEKISSRFSSTEDMEFPSHENPHIYPSTRENPVL